MSTTVSIADPDQLAVVDIARERLASANAG